MKQISKLFARKQVSLKSIQEEQKYAPLSTHSMESQTPKSSSPKKQNFKFDQDFSIDLNSISVYQVDSEQPEKGNLESHTYRYPLSLSQMSCIKLPFPQCLLKDNLARTSFPLSLFGDTVGETEFLKETLGFLLTLKDKPNLYYVIPAGNQSVFREFTDTADFGSLFPLFDPESTQWKFWNLRALFYSNLDIVFALQKDYQDENSLTTELICLEDVFKIPRAESTFSKKVLIKKEQILDFEFNVIEDEQSNDHCFEFLIATPRDLSILIYSRRRGTVQMKAIFSNLNFKVLYVMSPSMAIVEGSDSKGEEVIRKIQIRNYKIKDVGVLLSRSNVNSTIDQLHKGSPQKGLIKGKRGKFLIARKKIKFPGLTAMHSFVLFDRHFNRVAEVPLHQNPHMELHCIKSEGYYFVFSNENFLLKIPKSRKEQIEKINALLSEEVNSKFTRLSIIQTQNQILAIGFTSAKQEYLSVRFKGLDNSMFQQNSYQLHEYVDLRCVGGEQRSLPKLLAEAQITLIYQSARAIIYEADFTDGRQFYFLINNQTYQRVLKGFPRRQKRIQIFTDRDGRNPYPLAIVRVLTSPKKNILMQRNLSKLSIDDQETVSLELWTGGANLVPLDDFKGYFTEESELVDAL